MSTGNEDVDEAVLDLLQRGEGLMMDDLIAERPDFSWAQLFLAVDRLSRRNLIVLHQVGLNYQIFRMNQAVTHDQDQRHEQSAASHR